MTVSQALILADQAATTALDDRWWALALLRSTSDRLHAAEAALDAARRHNAALKQELRDRMGVPRC